MTEKLFLASIHDVGPRFEREVDQLATQLSGLLGGPRFAMLVVPDHWGEAPLAANPAYQAKLRRWAEQGVEMFVHGWFHKDLAQHSGMAAFKAKHMTASEGEFLGLTRAEAARRMADGRKLIEDIIGREPTGFIAPAWLYGEGARAALAAIARAVRKPGVAPTISSNASGGEYVSHNGRSSPCGPSGAVARWRAWSNCGMDTGLHR